MKRLMVLIFLTLGVGFQSHAVKENFSHINGKSYFEFFGLNHDANEAEVKSAYRNLMKRFHPDSGTEKNLEMAQLVNKVNDVLSSASRRQAYLNWLGVGGATDGQSEAEAREVELKKNALYVVKKAAEFKASHPSASWEEIAEMGRDYLAFAMRNMPGTNYTSKDLWTLISTYGQMAFENRQISAEAFVMLSGGALLLLKNRWDHGGRYGDEKIYLENFESMIKNRIDIYKTYPSRQEIWDTFWKILKGKSYFSAQAKPAENINNNCSTFLGPKLTVTINGVTYEIPITFTVKWGG